MEYRTGSGTVGSRHPYLSCPEYDLKVKSVETGVGLKDLEGNTPGFPHLLSGEEWEDIPLGKALHERKWDNIAYGKPVYDANCCQGALGAACSWVWKILESKYNDLSRSSDKKIAGKL